MGEARIAMIDLYFDSSIMSNLEKRGQIVKTVDMVLEKLYLKKKYETDVGETSFVIFGNENGSQTCILKCYPFGLVTLTFEDYLDESKTLNNIKTEELRKELYQSLKTRVENISEIKSKRVPMMRRGGQIPVYFNTCEERIVEYDFDELVCEVESPFQNIKILHSPTLGNCLFLDDLQNLADTDINYTRGVMNYGKISYVGKEVLILGGGDGGLLHELLKENPKFVTMVDIDQMVIDICRQHLRKCCGDSLDKLEGPNYKVVIDDCLVKLDEYKEQGRKFDVIINDLTDIPISPVPQGELWDFVKKIILKSFAVLKDDGCYLNHSLGEGCIEPLKAYEDVLSSLPFKTTFTKHSEFVPSFMERWVFYEVRKA